MSLTAPSTLWVPCVYFYIVMPTFFHSDRIRKIVYRIINKVRLCASTRAAYFLLARKKQEVGCAYMLKFQSPLVTEGRKYKLQTF